MTRQTVEGRARAAAPREAVWALLADAEGWSRWGIWEETRLERQGEPPGGGLGAVKHMVQPSRTVVEEVTVFEPPVRYGYRLLSGIPVKDYEAEVLLSEQGDGTEIVWRSQFAGRLPGVGGLVRRKLQPVMQDVAERLAREAERASSAT